VDSAGLVLAESLPDTSTLLPVVRDVPELSPEAGVRPDSAVLANALAVLDGISSEVLATVRAVSAPSVAETALVTADGVEIMVGEAVLLAEKSALIAGILAEQGSGVVFIDVRSIDRPISRGLE
jgi:hypothetical protein